MRKDLQADEQFGVFGAACCFRKIDLVKRNVDHESDADAAFLLFEKFVFGNGQKG